MDKEKNKLALRLLTSEVEHSRSQIATAAGRIEKLAARIKEEENPKIMQGDVSRLAQDVQQLLILAVRCKATIEAIELFQED